MNSNAGSTHGHAPTPARVIELDAYRRIWTHSRLTCSLCFHVFVGVYRARTPGPCECPSCHALACFPERTV